MNHTSGITKERRVTWLVALLLVVAAIVIGLLTWGSQERRLGGSSRSVVGGIGPFVIAGEVSQPMTPGVQVPIHLKVTNPYDVTISVSDMSVSVTKVQGQTSDATLGCSVDDFSVDQLPAGHTITVDKNSSVSLSSRGPDGARPTVELRNRAVNQDGCKNVIVELAYTARAKQVG